jgi:hydrogenase expression/formation protein HypE
MNIQCPVPLDRYPEVTLAHGGGGRLMNQLIEDMFLAAFENRTSRQRHDGAVVAPPPGTLALSADGFVVRPLAFPGGSIGSLAVYGTANDLVMCGARPLWLTAGFILEEGLPMATLWREVLAMQSAARVAGVDIVGGDTKVVERGKGDGMFVTTSGVGVVVAAKPIAPAHVRAGDAVLVSGDLGRHGMAVMAARDGLSFESTIESDCGYLGPPVLAMIEAGIGIHCLRDLTRGGLASALNEVAAVSGLPVELDEGRIRVGEAVRGACEVFGLDPMYVANEGRFAVWVPEADAERALEIMRRFDISSGADRIGRVEKANGRATVTCRNAFGSIRVVDMLSGEQLPRIC